jgi:hypothetical protein
MDAVFDGVSSSQQSSREPIVKFCETCGASGALKVGDRWLCESCYVEAGSCCLEFGGTDLWEDSSAAKQG